MTLKLESDEVEAIMANSLFEEGEDASNAIKVEGITSTFGFHPGRLESHRAEVKELLDQLPEAFHSSGGGGMSFLNACDDRDGRQWTGSHRIMEYLFALGEALGLATCLLPRDMWPALPGGMPYYMVVDGQ